MSRGEDGKVGRRKSDGSGRRSGVRRQESEKIRRGHVGFRKSRAQTPEARYMRQAQSGGSR